ncbi:MAG: dependent oxidoreductase [Actinotalea sp.]|nr:dependent oxidoreductase [Actinotalea sp.]
MTAIDQHTDATVALATGTPPGPDEGGSLPVVVIGAGPVGLAAGAHLASRGLPFLVLEAGDRVGAAVRSWGHIRTFTPWRYVVDPVAETLLARAGVHRPTTPVPPTGDELVSAYLEPLAAALGDRVRTSRRVIAVSRDGMDRSRSVGREHRPFLVRVQGPDGGVRDMRARAVIDASGTWGRPNPLGASGLPAAGEVEAAPYLVGGLPDVLGRDRDRFAGRRTLVVGSGHSAANTLLDLGRLAEEVPGTQVVWAVRSADVGRVYGGGAADELPARGRLGSDLRRLVESGVVELVAGFALTSLEIDGAGVAAGPGHDTGARGGSGTLTVRGTTAAGDREITGVHQVAAATGFRPDLTVLSEVRLDLDPGLEAPRRLAPLIDPAFHSCGTVPPHGHRDLAQPDVGLYVVGMKSYGRAPTFLITTGNEQVRSVVAALAGDLEEADQVRLTLPETGVCSTDATGRDTAAAGGCCGSDTGVAGLAVPAEAHRPRPAGVPAQGFTTGLAGGGALAQLVLADGPLPVGDSCGTGGCCTT